MLLAICKAQCDKCKDEAWLYIPQDDKHGLLCENCMNEDNLEIDQEATKKNLGGLYPQ